MTRGRCFRLFTSKPSRQKGSRRTSSTLRALIAAALPFQEMGASWQGIHCSRSVFHLPVKPDEIPEEKTLVDPKHEEKQGVIAPLAAVKLLASLVIQPLSGELTQPLKDAAGNHEIAVLAAKNGKPGGPDDV